MLSNCCSAPPIPDTELCSKCEKVTIFNLEECPHCHSDDVEDCDVHYVCEFCGHVFTLPES